MSCVKNMYFKFALQGNLEAHNLAPYILATGQIDTGQFGNSQFDTMTIKHQKIWYQDNLSPGQFGTRTI